jgi:hypothetical protein
VRAQEGETMTQMKYVIATFAASGLIISGAFAQTDRREPTKGSTVTLASCVEKAQREGTYVLTHVADVPVHASTHGRVVYWIDKDTAQKLRPHVGHQIRVSGTIADIEKHEMELKASDDGIYVEVEAPGRDIKAKPEQVGVSAAGRTPEKDDIKTTVVKLKVDRLDMVAANCPLAK